ncbi:acyl-CoA N-acyltransferase [Backusella circina FSU 941]|nr:acyl-CoA N-acyltransferase [Backusella circina FSU 941]
MPKYSNVQIIHVQTPKDLELSHVVRTAVFIVEQQRSPLTEKDDIDHKCQHWVALCTVERDDGSIESNVPVGTVRMIPKDNQIAKLGRLAVLSDARGLDIGKKLVVAFSDYCTANQYRTIVLHSQVEARGFYEKLGFFAEPGQDDIFTEDNTPHVRLIKRTD